MKMEIPFSLFVERNRKEREKSRNEYFKNTAKGLFAHEKIKDFEEATKDFEEFLGGSHEEFRKNNSLTERNFDSIYLALELLRLKIECMVSLGPKEKVIKYLKNLILSDKADGSNMPEIFRGRFLDKDWMFFEEQGDLIKNKYELEEENTELVNNIYSYRSDYFNIIIGALAQYGSEAESAIVDCLREMDKYCYYYSGFEENYYPELIKVKIGVDMTKEELWAKRKEWEEEFEKKGGTFVDNRSPEEREKDEIEAIEKENDYFADPNLSQFAPEEFYLPKIEAINYFSKLPKVSNSAIEYFIGDFLRKNYSGFTERFNDIAGILNKNPNFSIGLLLENIRRSDNKLNKTLLSKMLYRIKFGQAGISEEERGAVLSIDDQLKEQPEASEKLFSKCAQVIDGAEKVTDDLVKIYNEIFFDKQINKDKANYALLSKAFEILRQASEGLIECPESEKEKIIHDLILKLEREESILKKTIDILKKTFLLLQEKYKELSDKIKKYRDILLESEAVGNDYDERFKNYLKLSFQANVAEQYDVKQVQILIKAFYDKIGKLKAEINSNLFNVDNNKKEDEIDKCKREIVKLENLLLIQQVIEYKFDQFVYGEDNLDLPEDFQKIPAGKVFQKYQEIIDRAKNAKEEVKRILKGKEIPEEKIDLIINNLVTKAGKFLDEYIESVINEKEGDNDEKIDEQELINKLEGYNANLVLTASVWKSVDKSALKFEDLEGVTFEVKTIGRITGDGRIMSIADEISEKETDDKNPFIPGANIRGVVSKYAHEASPEERQRAQEILEMIDIYRKNYVNKPDLQKVIVDGFIDKLKTGSDDTLVYLYKKDGQVLAFNRFDRMGGGRKYFGSFNVEPSLHDSAIGSALLRSSLEKEADGNEIEGDCDPETSISSYYVERAGFVVDSIKPKYAGTKHTIFGIVRKKQNEQYAFRNMSHEELVSEHKQRFRGNVYSKDLPRMVLKYEKDSNELFESSERLINKEGYVMTRYFFDKNGKEAYCAFERAGN